MEFAPGPVRVGPLDHFPVIKDLVVEMDDFMAKLQKVRPWIVRKDDFKPEREYIQSPAQMETYHQFSLCINCTLCYAACPVSGTRFELHRARGDRPGASLQPRLARPGHSGPPDIVSQHEGIWDCTVVGECSTVCPKGVDPSLAIQQYKLTATKEWFKSFLLPRGKN